MKDTSADIDKKQLEILLKKTEEERFMIGDELASFGRTVMSGEIRSRNPQISETDLKLEMFKRCYEESFSADEMQRILESMRKYLQRSDVFK